MSTRWRRSRKWSERGTESAPLSTLNPRSTWVNLLPKYESVLATNYRWHQIKCKFEPSFLILLFFCSPREWNQDGLGTHSVLVCTSRYWKYPLDLTVFSRCSVCDQCVFVSVCSWMRLYVPAHQIWPVPVSISRPWTQGTLWPYQLDLPVVAVWG